MSRTRTYSLTTHGMSSLENYIKDYIKRECYKKLQSFIVQLAQCGIEIAKANIIQIDGRNEEVNFTYELEGITSSVGVCKLIGTGPELVFMEFGSGITYSSNQNPYNNKVVPNMGPGTYNPSSDLWKNPNGWHYTKDGKKIHTYGVNPSMPMYKALVEMEKNVRRIAKGTFGK